MQTRARQIKLHFLVNRSNGAHFKLEEVTGMDDAQFAVYIDDRFADFENDENRNADLIDTSPSDPRESEDQMAKDRALILELDDLTRG